MVRQEPSRNETCFYSRTRWEEATDLVVAVVRLPKAVDGQKSRWWSVKARHSFTAAGPTTATVVHTGQCEQQEGLPIRRSWIIRWPAWRRSIFTNRGGANGICTMEEFDDFAVIGEAKAA